LIGRKAQDSATVDLDELPPLLSALTLPLSSGQHGSDYGNQPVSDWRGKSFLVRSCSLRPQQRKYR